MLNPKLLAEAFPINKVEVFFDAEDHSNFLGFQWEMVSQGKMPIGLNTSDTDFNSIGKTGGEKEVTLTAEQIPPHHHDIQTTNTPIDKANYEYIVREYSYSSGFAMNRTEATGGGQPHNNMPPYIVMAFWKRIA